MKKLIITPLILLTACSQTSVEDYIKENKIPKSIEVLDEQNYVMHYDIDLSIKPDMDKMSPVFKLCSLKINVKNNKVLNKDNKEQTCTQYVLKDEKDALAYHNYTKNTIKGNKIKQELKKYTNI